MLRKDRNEKTETRAEHPKNWYSDKYQTVLVQRNIFAVVTLVSLLISLAAVFTIQHLTPLKSVEPFVIQVDEKTGVTEVVEPLTSKELSASEALDNYFIWQYVRARETYDEADNVRNREIVRVSSAPEAYSAYREAISPQTPDSPYNRLGQKGKRVCSTPVITYLEQNGKNVAQVRFVVTEYLEREAPFEYNKIATVEYDYVTLELTRAERFINPLGFRVVSYRLDDATVPR